MSKTKCIIALGSNMGERVRNIDLAIDQLELSMIIEVEKRSRYVESDPIGGPEGQTKYLNGVVLVNTELNPDALLAFLQVLEMNMGRQKGEKWGPRPIDLDIIFYGDQIIKSDKLTVPHPLVHERLFVLDPICQIAPEWIHPVYKQTVKQLRDALAAK